jgi:hypothetical protein
MLVQAGGLGCGYTDFILEDRQGLKKEAKAVRVAVVAEAKLVNTAATITAGLLALVQAQRLEVGGSRLPAAISARRRQSLQQARKAYWQNQKG